MDRWASAATVCVDSAETPLQLGSHTSGRASLTFDDYHLDEVAAAMYHPDVDVDVVFEQCGEENAYYYYGKKRVVMCVELLALDPGVVRYVLAHELAHAVIMQLDLPYTGSHEAAADELAAYVLIKMGRSIDLVTAGQWWLAMSEESTVPPWDDHPSHGQRFYTLTCLGMEALHLPGSLCRRDWDRVQHNWDRLLGL